MTAPRALARSRLWRHGRTLLLILLLLGGATGLLEGAIGASPLRLAEDKAANYLRESEVAAVEAFAIARSLNAGISFFKHVEFKPWGVGVSPFQALEPVDDVAEDFSHVMIFSMAAIFMQQIFHKISVAIGLNIALPIGCAVLIIANWLSPQSSLRERLSSFGAGIIALVIFARFVVPFSGWLGSEINRQFLADDLRGALHAMKSASLALERETQEAQAAADAAESKVGASGESDGILWNVFSKIENGARSVIQSAKGIVPDIGSLKNDLLRLPERMVLAIEIFIIKTVIVPGFLALVFYLGIRRFLGGRNGIAQLRIMTAEIQELRLAIDAPRGRG